MDNSSNSLNWFEIPASDIERSKKFYEQIFGIEMHTQQMGEGIMAFFPYSPASGKASGALVQSATHIPGMEGSKIYLNANPNMDGVLEKVEAAGGEILLAKMSIGENGHIAFIKDTEGNQVGIHSME